MANERNYGYFRIDMNNGLEPLKYSLNCLAENWQKQIEASPTNELTIDGYTFKKTKLDSLENEVWLCTHTNYGTVGIPCYENNLYDLCLDITYHKTIKELETLRRNLHIKQ
jgi:hypothetical protein